MQGVTAFSWGILCFIFINKVNHSLILPFSFACLESQNQVWAPTLVAKYGSGYLYFFSLNLISYKNMHFLSSWICLFYFMVL